MDRAVERYSALNLRPELLDPRRGLCKLRLPAAFAHDTSRSRVGRGLELFRAAAHAFEKWKQFDLGWVRVRNPRVRIVVGQIVAVEVRALGLWSLNLSQIVSVTCDAQAFGFVYKTTAHHAEEGEERFLLTLDPATEEVHYELEAISRPQHWLAKLGYPVTRSFQHKFARDSHRRLGETVSEEFVSSTTLFR